MIQISFDIDRVIATAEAEVGYLEKKNGELKYLYDKTKNAGDANYTKYGYEMHKIYPAVCDYPAAWCDCFCDWVFQKSCGVSTARKMIGNFDDYTPNSANLYKQMGAWYALPKRGDQIFFKNSTRIYHTGIVVDVKNDTVFTIEGNTSGGSAVIANGGGVCRKSYPITYTKIAGYGRPAYQKDIAVTPGWRRAKDGKRWWYEYADGTWAIGWTALECSNGKHWYYFDEDGYMLTGRQEIDGKTYILDDSEGANEGACWRSDADGSQHVWFL